MKRVIFVVFVAASVNAAAQQQSGLFRDPDSGVTFRYPAAWATADRQPFMFPLLVSEPGKMPRMLVFTRTIRGVSHWPTTEFGGAAFGYDIRRAASPEECHSLALPAVKHATRKGQVTLQGLNYWRSTCGDGGMSQQLTEDIYATYVASSNSCLLFDFGLSTVLAPGAVPPRALNASERGILQRLEMNILASIRVPKAASVQ
ncbi:MAG TPA: hypothetical protein VKR52_13465 [Terracidiphilus sp.]|nr:hypothetical protein [Terracidiphilus sp.]